MATSTLDSGHMGSADLSIQEGILFFLSPMSAAGGQVDGTDTSAGGRYLWLQVQEAERVTGASMHGAARMSELRPAITDMFREFYDQRRRAPISMGPCLVG